MDWMAKYRFAKMTEIRVYFLKINKLIFFKINGFINKRVHKSWEAGFQKP